MEHTNETIIPVGGSAPVAVKKATHNLVVKTVAVLLFAIFLCTALFCAGLTAFRLIDEQSGAIDAASSDLQNGVLQRYNNYAESCFWNQIDSASYYNDSVISAYASFIDPKNTNYRYTITDADGNIVKSTLDSSEVVKGPSLLINGPRGADGTYTLNGYYTKALAADDSIRATVLWTQFVYQQKNMLFVGGIAATVLCILLLIYLMCASGRHSDSYSPRRTWFDKIPFDLLLLIDSGIIFALCFIVVQGSAWMNSIFSLACTMLICGTLAGLLLLSLCMTVGARVKTHTFWKTNVIAWCVLLVWRFIKWICGGIAAFFTNLPLLWKSVLIFCGVGLFFLITCLGFDGGISGLLFFVGVIALLAVVCIVTLQWQRLQNGAKALACGHLEQKIDTDKMHGSIKTHADNLNCIGDGMGRAVEARMKSERMKTDLITNVSHDLKTPLTSIVSYVDLLKKEDLHNETASGYVTVLDRQSAKLKKLTEDLVEASKASSGAITVNLVPTDAKEILSQSLAEYAEKLAAANLTPVVTVSDEPLRIMADGRLLWRVFDNLLNNVCKYSQPNTRVYCNAEKSNGQVIISIRNISRDALNITAAELTERFVRGDSARSSEGSGLGLSIAKSLTELQKGVFLLYIDGDLFRAEVRFSTSFLSEERKEAKESQDASQD